ncbi:FecCD family ABC transporter permease [Nocardiopsis potens]|uniref:FecCD family ABC transporter permease n=1 Tax=Nocardiopsis potens TaxID=1246458 RepID=UPI000348F952|nr:iron ABC transporter permease [Nocardiopsis potens]
MSTDPGTAAGPGRDAPPSARRGTVPLPLLLPILVAAVPVAATFGVIAGSVDVSFTDTWRIVAHRAFPGLVRPDWPPAHEAIVTVARAPRVLLAALAGAGLAAVGAALQTLVRNPLADPLLLGISSGATLGAVLVVVTGFSVLGLLTLPLTAFLGALLALAAVYALAQARGRMTATRLILSGVVVGQLCHALASLSIMLSGDPHVAKQVQRWTLGGLAGTTWQTLPVVAAAVLAALLAIAAAAPALNVLQLGEETAVGMGLAVNRFRVLMFTATSLATGVLVSVCGPIGFVGLMMPHIARLLVGSDHRRVLPVAILLGASFMILADLAARTLAAPEEIPVGILTALCGAPFFLWLMRRDARRGGRRLI